MRTKHFAALLLVFVMVFNLLPLSTVASAESGNESENLYTDLLFDSDFGFSEPDDTYCMHYETENNVVVVEGTCMQPEVLEGNCISCGEKVQKYGYYGEHNYVMESIHDFVMTMKCEYCSSTSTSTIPESITLYSVSDSDDYGISYETLKTKVYTNAVEYVYVSFNSFSFFNEIEFIVSDPELLTIKEAFDVFSDCYSFSFAGEGTVKVTVVSKYDNRIKYGTYTFTITEKPRSGDINGDGSVTSADARLILRVAANISKCSSATMQYADTDGNGKVTAADARLVLRVSAKIDKASSLVEFEPDIYGSWWYENSQELTLYEGNSRTLNYFILRENSPITWKSSNPAAVKVDKNGKITAVKKGYACIIVSNGEETFYYEVNVKNSLQKKIDKLRDKYPEGYYWNNHAPSKKYPNVTETPCNDHESGRYAYCKGQCAGFAALLFDEVHGNAKRSYGVNWNNVKIGDYLRLKRHHSVFVIDVIKKGEIIGYSQYDKKNIVAEETYIIVAHCNWGWTCNISWDDTFMQDYEIDSSLSYTVK